jgi:hypothetical protein
MKKAKKKKRSKGYDPLVKTNLSFDEMLKLAATTSLPKKEKIKGSRSKKKLR